MIDGLLCVGERLANGPFQQSAKHPVILPKSHHIVPLIIRQYHNVSGHSGVEYVLSLIREKFWIVGARTAVRRCLNACVPCKRRQAPGGEQKMADLPLDRITPDKPPFTYVGVDCFGPFLIRRGRTEVKRYGVLYTCLVVRAVHIEVHGPQLGYRFVFKQLQAICCKKRISGTDKILQRQFCFRRTRT